MNDKKAPSWAKLQNWFVEKLVTHDGGISPLPGGEKPLTRPINRDIQPEKYDYQLFLEKASRTMIRFKKPEHLIKMIVRTIDEQLHVTHTAVLLYKENKNAYILIDSKGSEGSKFR